MARLLGRCETVGGRIGTRDTCGRILLYAWIAVVLGFSPGLAQAGFTDRTSTLFPTTGETITGWPASWADYNNDGYVDVSIYGRLFRNNAGAGFTFVGYAGDIWGDYNNDGRLDAYGYTSDTLNRNLSTGSTTSFDRPITMPPLAAGGDVSNGTNRGASWADFDGDGYIDLYVTGYETGGMAPYDDTLMMNNSATSCTGSTISPWAANARGVTSCDWDEDGDMDVYVSNYWLTANRLWRNDGTGSFTNVASSHNATAGSGHSIGAAWGDIDNDGDFDLFAGNFSHYGQPQSRFLENRGSGFDYAFTDKGTCGVSWVESYASPTLGDYDNDGDLDLFFTAVYTSDSRLYRNDGNWNFTNVTAAEGLSGQGPTYQAAWADFDNDGDLDLVTNGRIFVNNGNANHWLKVHLQGDGVSVNAAAIGAQVRLDVPGLGTITRQVETVTGESNQNDPTMHFGLGSHSSPVQMEIRWPDGTTRTYTVNVDQTLTISMESPPPLDLYAGVVGGHGTVEPMSGTYEWDTVVTLTATPDLCYRVKAWNGTNDDGSTSNVNTVTMTGDYKIVTVEFEIIPYTITKTLLSAGFETSEGYSGSSDGSDELLVQGYLGDTSNQQDWYGEMYIAGSQISNAAVVSDDVAHSGTACYRVQYRHDNDPVVSVPRERRYRRPTGNEQSAHAYLRSFQHQRGCPR